MLNGKNTNTVDNSLNRLKTLAIFNTKKVIFKKKFGFKLPV